MIRGDKKKMYFCRWYLLEGIDYNYYRNKNLY